MMNYNETNSLTGKQDGVAAQCKDGGLPITNKVYIKDQPPVYKKKEDGSYELDANGNKINLMDDIKNFNEAHYSKNYWWVFNIDTDQNGYVKKR
jgi:hypothetical protein